MVQLIYSGLLKYNSEGKLTEDLAESYEVSEDSLVYTFHLRKNARWHDGEAVSAADLVFTVNALQDPAYKSPLRYNWQGVEVRQIDDYTVSFSLKSPYFGFLGNLTTGILPKHIWENVSPEKFSLADYNLRPIGSGPYKFTDFQKDSGGNILSYDLNSFPEYYKGKPYISRITLYFYPDESSLVEAYNKKEIKGMNNITPEGAAAIKDSKNTVLYELGYPRYFSVFFNQNKSVPLASDEVRLALAAAVNRQEIIDKVLFGKGVAVYFPFLPQMSEYATDVQKQEFDIEKANKILDDNKWERGDDGIREKNGVKLEFDLLTSDWPELAQTADILHEQWKKIGVDAKVSVLAISDLQQNYIRPREYDALLFGQVANLNPDPYPYWHSDGKRDPGLNFALFDDKNADALLEEARGELDEQKRIEKYREFQKILSEKNPAVFLYSPYYIYPVDKQVKGIDAKIINNPSGRFANVEEWYIKTKRVRK